MSGVNATTAQLPGWFVGGRRLRMETEQMHRTETEERSKGEKQRRERGDEVDK